MQKTVRQPFSFKEKPKSVNGVFKISLGRSFAALLKFKKIIFDFFGIQFGRDFSEMKSDCSDVPRIIIKGSGTSAQDRNIPFKTLQKFGETINFA